MQTRTGDSVSSATQTMSVPLLVDYVLVPRQTLLQLQSHITTEHERFPARRLRQALRIIRHILGQHVNETV